LFPSRLRFSGNLATLGGQFAYQEHSDASQGQSQAGTLRPHQDRPDPRLGKHDEAEKDAQFKREVEKELTGKGTP
jgi:hypothetical protein